jgi:polysaccharide export outer membrane protein
LLIQLGCAHDGGHVDRQLMANQNMTPPTDGIVDQYTVGCPDLLEVIVNGRPALSGRHAIGPDGRIDLGPDGCVRVEGRTLVEAAALVAQQLGVLESRVRVHVVEFNSRQIYLSGAGTGVSRAVPYRGPEPVYDLLRRVGGVTPGAAPEDVYVVRPHIADGERPEVFHIDLRGIVMSKDGRTNIRLQPFDQVYVGETRQGKLEKCLPGWMRPLYQALWDIGPRKATFSATSKGLRES